MHTAFLAALILAASDLDTESRPAFAPKAGSAFVVPSTILGERSGVSIVHGGFGSAMARDPKDPNVLYLLTDRGPNVSALAVDVKVFPVPEFTPRIGVFELGDKGLTRASVIEPRGADGRKLGGAPPAPARGVPVEAGLDASGKRVAPDAGGIDPEGLAAMPDGTFWIAEEYGPSLLHVAKDGAVLEWVRPGPEPRDLPLVLTRRRPNGGFEGLTRMAGSPRLAAIVQAPLGTGFGADTTARVVRILTFDAATGKTAQFLYPLVSPSTCCSDVALGLDGRLLVLERDSGVPGDKANAAVIKRVYAVDLAKATDVSDPRNTVRGLEVGGRVLEALTLDDLAAAGIRLAEKRLVLDLLALGYPHEKPEGLAVFDNGVLGVVNDDDFGIAPDGKGGVAPKRLPAAGGSVDAGTLRFYRLDK
jgi:hypothetical protein